MNIAFSNRVSQILAFSREEAFRLENKEVSPEHIVLGMLRINDDTIEHLLSACGVERTTLKASLEEIAKGREHEKVTSEAEIALDIEAGNLLKLAVMEARLQRTQTIDVLHLLLAMLSDQSNTETKKILEENHMTYDKLKDLPTPAPGTAITNSLELPEEEETENTENDATSGGAASQHAAATATQAQRGSGKTPVLDGFSTDLTQAAREGKLDPVVGREKEMQRVLEILSRRKKNNPILIGEPGVGKSSIVEGLAQLIVQHKTSPLLFNKRVVNLDMTGIVAGTKYRGQFEERLKALIKELEENPDIIVFLDEIHTLVGAGGAPGSMDAANIMKPALARGVIQCIGATTLDEFRNSIEKDGALERRFQKVLVEPSTAEETLHILENIKERYEAYHHVHYTDDALKACVRLTDRYISDRFFPDKAIDALDEVGAKVHLQHAEVPAFITEKEKEIEVAKAKKQMAVKNQNFELAASFRDRQTVLEKELQELSEQWKTGNAGTRETVDEADVAEVVSRMSGVPVQKMAEGEGIQLKNMGPALKEAVVGQDKAIDKMVKAIQRNRIGLKDPNRPIGVFMFLGPTGVGKTYLAKKLAEAMFGSADALIRVDMSEYTESFNVSRLVGAPPGYVGYEEGGQLTERVRRHPYSIVLLDEIEKAHANVFNLLLQVLDEGRLTDGLGRVVDFKNTIVIMTSNAGTRQLKEFGRGVGFNAGGAFGADLNDKDKEYARQIVQKSLSKQFPPEFLNRLDEIITFDQLDLKAITAIVDIELKSVYKRIEDLGYKLVVDEPAKEFVAGKGYDVQYGARPLKRAIQTYIEDGVCEAILNGDAQGGDTLVATVGDDKNALSFHVQKAALPPMEN